MSFQYHYDDECDKTVFHNPTPDLQDQDQDRYFLVSDRSCPKTDGLGPHHWSRVSVQCSIFVARPHSDVRDIELINRVSITPCGRNLKAALGTCEQLAQGRYSAMHRPEVEPTTC